MAEGSKYGDWDEEKLFVLRTLEELKQQQLKQAERAAVLADRDIAKAHTDIQRAYVRIRDLETSNSKQATDGTTMKIKNWILIGLLSFLMSVLGPLLFELAKGLIHR